MESHIKIISILIIFSLFGCSKVDEYTQFEMDYDSEVVIPSSTGLSLPIDVFTPDVETNSESEFAVNDTKKELVEEIKLTELTLEITSPSGADFSFLESIEIFIAADGLDDLKVASKENISDDTGSKIELETSNSDLKEYIKKETFTLKANTVTDEALSQDHTINIHSVFFVDAKILGQ